MKVLCAYGVPNFEVSADKRDWLEEYVRTSELFTNLVPEPTDNTLRDLLDIYKPYPTSEMFYGRVVYLIFKVLECTDK